MSRRGYFEKQNGDFRLRIVAEGYDADDENVPPNKVIIDSRDLATLSVLRSGLITIPTRAAGNDGLWITQWSLPYIPLCTFQYGSTLSTPDYWTGALPAAYTLDLLVSRNGIYFNANDTLSNGWFPLQIRWAAFRIPVVS